MKLTEAQLSCLQILGDREDQLIVNYGSCCGVKRSVAAALAARGLAIYLPEVRDGVSARITPAGRAALEQSKEK